MPFFAVVIPLFNKETFVANAINSILNQTFQDFEIIIVEDCSNDASLNKAAAIQSEKIQIIQHEKNKGLSAARNTGIKAANAKYIAFLDADDEWKPGYLEKIHNLIQQFPEAQLFATNYEERYPKSTIIASENKSATGKKEYLVTDFFESNLRKPMYFPGSLCVAKSVFDTVGYFDNRITYAEDVDFNIRVNHSFQLAYSEEVLVTYTMFSENQITNSHFSRKVIPNFNAYESWAQSNKSLKKYLDFNRYIMAQQYKIENDLVNYNKLKSEINFNSLNAKQRFLLAAPRFVLLLAKKLKRVFIGKGIMLTTYD